MEIVDIFDVFLPRSVAVGDERDSDNSHCRIDKACDDYRKEKYLFRVFKRKLEVRCVESCGIKADKSPRSEDHDRENSV